MANTGVNHSGTQAGLNLFLVVGGALIGAVVALLYAPQSGQRTRRQILRKYEDVRDRAADLSDGLVERVGDLGRSAVRQIDAGKDYVGEKKEELLAGISSRDGSLSSLRRRLTRN
jgi:gas vesicle protein